MAALLPGRDAQPPLTPAGRRRRALALLLLLAAASASSRALAAQSPPPKRVPPAPWSDLDPYLDRTDAVLLGEVVGVQPLGRVGTRVTIAVSEQLYGGSTQPSRLSYLAPFGTVVHESEKEVILLASPDADGHHYKLVAKIGGRDRRQPEKLRWLRELLAIRSGPRLQRPREFVELYLRELRSAGAWSRERALAELERLQQQRGAELRARLDPDRLLDALKRFPEKEGPRRKRLYALLQWRMKPGATPRAEER